MKCFVCKTDPAPSGCKVIMGLVIGGTITEIPLIAWLLLRSIGVV